MLKRFKNLRIISGRISIGNFVFYGIDTAMHLSFEWWSKKYGYICFHPPVRWHKRWWPFYLYFSPNGTPQLSTFAIGKGIDLEDRQGANARKMKYGHNFDPNLHCFSSPY